MKPSQTFKLKYLICVIFPRAILRKMKAGKYQQHVQDKAAYVANRPTESTYKLDNTDEVFNTIIDGDEEERKKEGYERRPVKVKKRNKNKNKTEDKEEEEVSAPAPAPVHDESMGDDGGDGDDDDQYEDMEDDDGSD